MGNLGLRYTTGTQRPAYYLAWVPCHVSEGMTGGQALLLVTLLSLSNHRGSGDRFVLTCSELNGFSLAVLPP